jgi:hypothetical protein
LLKRSLAISLSKQMIKGVTFSKEVVAGAREVDPNTALWWATIPEEVQEILQRVSPDAGTWKW